MTINASAIDPRIKATVASTMNDMSRFTAYGYFDKVTVDKRYENKKNLCNQIIEYYKKGEYKHFGFGKVSDDDPSFIKDYNDYYKTKRGYHSRSLNSNNGFCILVHFLFEY